tara:strand:+ start:89 stop:460 length:372 start_codon:yes stop_codon:yes gene_type:complete
MINYVMVQNLSFSLNEVTSKSTNIEEDLTWMSEFQNDSENDEILSKELLLELEFNEYSVKDLIKFCDYYKIPRKRKKQEVIEALVLFECEYSNNEIVETRRTLWEYILVLKDDNYFKRFILFD